MGGKKNPISLTSYFCKASLYHLLFETENKAILSLSMYLYVCLSFHLFRYQSFIYEPFNMYIIIFISIWVPISVLHISILSVCISHNLSPYLFIERVNNWKSVDSYFFPTLKARIFKVDCYTSPDSVGGRKTWWRRNRLNIFVGSEAKSEMGKCFLNWPCISLFGTYHIASLFLMFFCMSHSPVNEAKRNKGVPLTVKWSGVGWGLLINRENSAWKQGQGECLPKYRLMLKERKM